MIMLVELILLIMIVIGGADNDYFQARLEIVDLFVDLGDGVLLMKLLEIISGEKLGKPNRGRMRVQKIENLNKTLDFLKKKRIQVEFFLDIIIKSILIIC